MSKILPSVKERTDSVRDLLEKFKPQMELALPKHVNGERLLRLALIACGKNTQLLDCTGPSLVGALMLSAQMGLEPDGIYGALVPYKIKGKLEAQFQPMYKGLLKLAWQSNQLAGVQVGVVRPKDHFVYRKGLDAACTHVPYAGAGDPGPLTHAYSVISTTGGGEIWDVMNAQEIAQVRASSRSASSEQSAWNTHPGEMWKKTVLRRVLKLAPCSMELMTAITEDEKLDAGIPQDLPIVDLGTVEAKEPETPEEEPTDDDRK